MKKPNRKRTLSTLLILTAILLVGCDRKGSPCIEKGSSSLAKPPIAIDVIAPAVANQMAGERFVRVGEVRFDQSDDKYYVEVLYLFGGQEGRQLLVLHRQIYPDRPNFMAYMGEFDLVLPRGGAREYLTITIDEMMGLLPVHDEAGGLAFTLENPEDEVVLAMHGKNPEVKIKCPRGIGRGKLSRLAGVEEWPEQIVFLIRYDDGKPFKVLEGFNITGKQLNISGTSDGVMGSKVEKTEDAIKITIPGIILAGESEVNVQWIDYYRR